MKVWTTNRMTLAAIVKQKCLNRELIELPNRPLDALGRNRNRPQAESQHPKPPLHPYRSLEVMRTQESLGIFGWNMLDTVGLSGPGTVVIVKEKV
jgi:hypothetical protein